MEEVEIQESQHEKQDSNKDVTLSGGFARTENCMIIKNIAAMSASFMLNFTAFASMQNLQSSLNLEAGLGTAGLSTLYGALVLSVLFLPTPVTEALGCKWTMVLGTVPYLLYTAANAYATWWTILPAAVLVGVGGAVLWPAQSNLLTLLSRRYAELTGASSHVYINRFFSMFFMSFQSAQIWGSLMVAFILQSRPEGGPVFPDLPPEEIALCGAAWCGDAHTNNTNLEPPDNVKLYVLCGAYFVLGVLAIVIMAVFVNDGLTEQPKQGRRGLTCDLALATLRHLRDHRQLWLIPLSTYSGLEQAFFAGDYTKSYVSCVLGIWAVGLIVLAYAIVNAASCLLLSGVGKYAKRPLLFSLGALLHFAAQIALLVWKPNVDQVAVFFILAGVWGAGDAIWNTQINALYGCVFPLELEAAFANCTLWRSVGFIVAFGYSNYFCTDVKLYILASVLLAGMVGYFIVEKGEQRRVVYTF